MKEQTMQREETEESKMWFRRTNLRPEKCWQEPEKRWKWDKQMRINDFKRQGNWKFNEKEEKIELSHQVQTQETTECKVQRDLKTEVKNIPLQLIFGIALNRCLFMVKEKYPNSETYIFLPFKLKFVSGIP